MNSNPGYLVEQLFFEQINKFDIFKDIKHEDELKKHNWCFASVDYLLVTDNGIIPVQIKYRGTRRRENLAIQNFLNAIKRLNELYDKPILFGMWLSRLKPFDDNKELLNSYNIKCIDEFNNMDMLIQKGVKCIIDNI